MFNNPFLHPQLPPEQSEQRAQWSQQIQQQSQQIHQQHLEQQERFLQQQHQQQQQQQHHHHQQKQGGHSNQPAQAPLSRLQAILLEMENELKLKEMKFNEQVSEMAIFQSNLLELKRMYLDSKARYEMELGRLRGLLESNGIPIPPAPIVGASPLGFDSSAINSVFGNSEDGRRRPANFDDSPSKRLREYNAPISSGAADINTFLSTVTLNSEITNVNIAPHPYVPMMDLVDQHPFKTFKAPLPPNPPDTPSFPTSFYKMAPETPSLSISVDPSVGETNLVVTLVQSFKHQSVVTCVKFSPDGKYLATGSGNLIQIFETVTGKSVLTLINHRKEEKKGGIKEKFIRTLCFSPDGRFLATGAEDHQIRVWDIVKGMLKFQLSQHTREIFSVNWTKDGKYIVSGSENVKVWDAETGVCFRTLQSDTPQPDGDKGPISSVAISGLCVAAAYMEGGTRVWDLRTGHLLEIFDGGGYGYSVSFAPDAHSIVVGNSVDNSLRLWDLSPSTLAVFASTPNHELRPEVTITSRYRRCFLGHEGSIFCTAFPGSRSTIGRVDSIGRTILAPDQSLDGVEWIVSGGRDPKGRVMFWDAKGSLSQPLLTISGHKDSVFSLDMAPSGGLFATGSGDHFARVIRLSYHSTS